VRWVKRNRLPNELRQLGERLLVALSRLLRLVANTLRGMSTAASAQKIKAMRTAAALKVRAHIEKGHRAALALEASGAEVAEARAEFESVDASLEPHIPARDVGGAESDDDDDDYY